MLQLQLPEYIIFLKIIVNAWYMTADEIFDVYDRKVKILYFNSTNFYKMICDT